MEGLIETLLRPEIDVLAAVLVLIDDYNIEQASELKTVQGVLERLAPASKLIHAE